MLTKSSYSNQMQTRVVLQNLALTVNLQPKHAILKTFTSRTNLVEIPTIKIFIFSEYTHTVHCKNLGSSQCIWNL